jgi:acyl carrier protein
MSAMSRPEIEKAVRNALAQVAPEADLSAIDPKRALRDQLDLDSMDFLNFVIAVHRALGVDIPERDYARLATLDSCVEYLARRPG